MLCLHGLGGLPLEVRLHSAHKPTAPYLHSRVQEAHHARRYNGTHAKEL